MISLLQPLWRDIHRDTGALQQGLEVRSRRTKPTSHFGHMVNVPHLPTILKWYISSVLTTDILGCIQYHISDGEGLLRIQNLPLLMFVDLFGEMDRPTIDTQMAYLQECLLMPTDNPELQWLVSKLLQPVSTCHRLILAKESL